MRAPLLLALALVGFASCSSTTAPTPVSNLLIAVDKPEYTASEANVYGVRATVTNMSSDADYYSMLGDPYGPIEQSTLGAAIGTQARIERRAAFGWSDVTEGETIEGARVVVLRAGSSYRLIGQVASNSRGTYRIRLDYSASADDPSSPILREYSAEFLVR